MTCVCIPGKIILFGEHAVVYGRPAIAVPVTQVQVTVTVCASEREGVFIDAPDISLFSNLESLSDHPLGFTINRVFSTLEIQKSPSLTIHISSTIPVASGLGSGAAVSVAIIRSLSSFLGYSLTDEQVNALSYETEKLHHGTPSGIDNSVITYAKPVYFVKGNPIETLRVSEPFTIVIGDTGISSLTKESVGDVRKLWKKDHSYWENQFDKVGNIVQKARAAIERGDPDALGSLMNANHTLLQQMTVSCEAIDHLVEVSRKSGALGAKLSGSGRGGNMIALVTPESAKKISDALLESGARQTIITTIEESPG